MVLFAADDDVHGTELWGTDGHVARLIDDIDPGAGWSNPNGFTAAGTQIFFGANDGVHGLEPWVMNRTALPRDPPTGPPGRLDQVSPADQRLQRERAPKDEYSAFLSAMPP